MAFDFNNRTNDSGSGFSFGDDQEEYIDETIEEPFFDDGFASFDQSEDEPFNNLDEQVEMTEIMQPRRHPRRPRPVRSGGQKHRSPGAANVPWKWLAILIVVGVVIALIAIYWDAILAFLAQLVSILITLLVLFLGLRSLFRSR